MTGYTVHTGSNDKFASGWDQIFSGSDEKPTKKAGKKAKAAKAAKKEIDKKATRKAKRGK